MGAAGAGVDFAAGNFTSPESCDCVCSLIVAAVSIAAAALPYSNSVTAKTFALQKARRNNKLPNNSFIKISPIIEPINKYSL
jgi:hypothetical protein